MKRSDWPTLGSLIDSGKRVVVFMDAGADGSDGGVVDFISPEFPNVRPHVKPPPSFDTHHRSSLLIYIRSLPYSSGNLPFL